MMAGEYDERDVLTGQVPVPEQPPACRYHEEVQHRDGRRPWCDACGWRHGQPATPAEKVR